MINKFLDGIITKILLFFFKFFFLVLLINEMLKYTHIIPPYIFSIVKSMVLRIIHIKCLMINVINNISLPNKTKDFLEGARSHFFLFFDRFFFYY